MPEIGKSERKVGLASVVHVLSLLVETIASDELDRETLTEKLRSLIQRIDDKTYPDARGVLQYFLAEWLWQEGTDHQTITRALWEPSQANSESAVKAKPFNMKIGPVLKQRIQSDLSDPKLAGMICGFLIRAKTRDRPAALIYGFYNSAQAAVSGPLTLFQSGDIQFFIPQTHVREKLEGKTIEYGKNGLLIVDELS